MEITLTKSLILYEDVAVLSVYALNSIAAIYVKQKLIGLKGEIDKSTVILGYFNTPLSTIDRPARQKINKQLEFNTLPIKRI